MYADLFDKFRPLSPNNRKRGFKIGAGWRMNWPSREEIVSNATELSAKARDGELKFSPSSGPDKIQLNRCFLFSSEWKVDLAIDVPAGPVRVIPERNNRLHVKRPVHLFTARVAAGFDGDNPMGVDFDQDSRNDPKLKVEGIPVVVSFPSHIEARRIKAGSMASVEPFDRRVNPPFTTHLGRYGESKASFTQLNVQVSRTSQFHVDYVEDHRQFGSPYSFDTTYLLLELWQLDPEIPPYRVLFRARIVLREGGGLQDPNSWVPWRRNVSFPFAA